MKWMGLLQKAYDTYENHSALIGVVKEGDKAPLLPVAHNIQKTQIEIAIDISGNFQCCRVVDKEDSDTVIPVTIESAGRSGKNPPPHPLSDKLQYLHPGDKDKYEAYVRLLSDWCESDYGNKKAKAVLEYIKKGTIINDIHSTGIGKEKVNNTDLESCLVRWLVMGTDDGEKCWRDLKLFKSWTDYYGTVLENEDECEGEICYITGTKEKITANHPKGVIKAANGAKLISANDSVNFTYRGRFTDKDGRQAATVGYYASQKAHNALRWLVSNQGFGVGGNSSRWYVCWNPKGKQLPKPHISFLRRKSDDNNQGIVTPSDYKKQLRATINGYKNDMPPSADAVIAAFDAATTGRLSLTYYNELQASDFLDRVHDWYSTCCWYRRYGRGYRDYYVNSPSVYDVLACAYGTEQGDKLVPPEKICGEQGQQLIKCIVEQGTISRSLVQSLFSRANQRQACSEENYEKLLFVACSIIRKYLNDKTITTNKEEWTMALEPEKKDRSYQYGRLLAVLEKVERDTYSEGESREPNAIRLQTVYCERPLTTFDTIHRSLQPYFAGLKKGSRDYYKRLIGEIVEVIQELPDGERNTPLKETYLFGYYLQRQALYDKKDKSKDTNAAKEENTVKE